MGIVSIGIGLPSLVLSILIPLIVLGQKEYAVYSLVGMGLVLDMTTFITWPIATILLSLTTFVALWLVEKVLIKNRFMTKITLISILTTIIFSVLALYNQYFQLEVYLKSLLINIMIGSGWFYLLKNTKYGQHIQLI
jgi:cell shape-determining protein MreD